jgi:hypothetical protein
MSYDTRHKNIVVKTLKVPETYTPVNCTCYFNTWTALKDETGHLILKCAHCGEIDTKRRVFGWNVM